MYWWNLRAAKRELSEATPASRRLLPYVMALAVLETLVIELSFMVPAQGEFGLRIGLFAVASAVVTALGCLYVYRRNGGAGGKQFLERILVLGWITGIRYTAFMALAIVLFFGLAVPLLGEEIANWTDVLYLLATPVFYLYLGRHIGDLARGGGPA
jgi:hypothetical protein